MLIRDKTAALIALLPIALILPPVLGPTLWGPILYRGLLTLSVLGGAWGLLTGLRREELVWFWLSLLFVAGQTVSVMWAENEATALHDIIRQGHLIVFAVLLVPALRNSAARRVLYKGCLVVSLLTAGVIICRFCSVREGSLAPWGATPTFAKNTLDGEDPDSTFTGYNLVLFSLVAMPVWSRSRVPMILFCCLSGTAILLHGTRLALIAVLAGLLFVNGYRWYFQKRCARIVLLMMVLGTIGCLAVAGREPWPEERDITRISSGRLQLWKAAIRSIGEKPLTGSGSGGWEQGIQRYLDSSELGESKSIRTLPGGGYHNAFLNLFAEKGAVAFALGVVLVWYVWHLSVRLAGKANGGQSDDDQFRKVAGIAMLAITIRMLGESVGLFGYANGPADYLAYIICALVVALAATPSCPRCPPVPKQENYYELCDRGRHTA